MKTIESPFYSAINFFLKNIFSYRNDLHQWFNIPKNLKALEVDQLTAIYLSLNKNRRILHSSLQDNLRTRFSPKSISLFLHRYMHQIQNTCIHFSLDRRLHTPKRESHPLSSHLVISIHVLFLPICNLKSLKTFKILNIIE